ncbi:hypothetical protein EUTSA_v10017593mg [Eutrema salsugineum]|uniref:DUF629 domain-containing protein n=2 Tax=Eutrema salsugineum TaxID=72664 RepID=V4MAA3_EUTSA|nr:hypothetical protein EUTSA_v10017593mg [Eutrema salsugineum]
MTTTSEKTEKEIIDAYEVAKGFFEEADHIKALETTEKTISDHGIMNQFCSPHHQLQGDIFSELARKTDITDIKCVYLFASVDSYSTSTRLCPQDVSSFCACARSLMELGDQLGINKFYKKAESKARRGLSSLKKMMLKPQETENLETQLQSLINLATVKMNSNATATASDTMANDQMESGKQEQGKEDPYVDRMNNLWGKLDGKTKREFLVVDTKSLLDYIKNLCGNKVTEHFAKCVYSVVEDKLRWRWWKCRICPQVNYCFTDYKWHILDNHVHKFQPRRFFTRPKCVDKVLADMICCGNWEPVDVAKAKDLIMSKTKRREKFAYVNGWCSDWPVANDKKRKDILKQFSHLLKSSCSNENDTLPCSLWDWLIDYTEENLPLSQVPGSYLDKCNFFENPQCICFLDLKNLEYILEYFRQLIITDVRTRLVSTAVNRFWGNSLVKERIDLERGTCNLLLDERLLYEGEHHDFDDDTEAVRTFNSSKIYEHVIPKGDKLVSWVLDCPAIDTDFVSQVVEGIDNLEIWLAVLRIVRCTARKEESYYNKRDKLITYGKMLDEAETTCDNEDNRKNANQRVRYALVLQMLCEARQRQDNATTCCLLNVVRDVLQGAESPRFEVLEDKEFMECISGLSTIQNDVVRESLLKLRKSLNDKFHLIDSKILLNEWTYKKLHEFIELSATENRVVILPFVKMYLQDKLKKTMKTHNRTRPVTTEASSKKGRR